MDKVKFGIIGCGLFAERRLLPAFQQSEYAELVAIQKRDVDIARQKADENNINGAYGTPEDLLADPAIDAVFIATPNNMHHPHTLLAAIAGKHVLVEKPMALNPAEAEDMVAACQDAGVLLQVGHQQRFLPVVQQTRALVSEGELGTIIFASSQFSMHAENSPRTWVRDKAVAGGGPVVDLGVHCIDLLRYLLGQEVRATQVFFDPSTPVVGGGVENAASVLLQFNRGTLGNIQVGFISEFSTYFEFRGTAGAVWARNFTQYNTEVDLFVQHGDDVAKTE
ncbi:MAG TPA: Gfo/Idh/MocA family oxidoreductase, partial [Candidatus Lokiarchaeia archaeon]|nr:Gfo/Idh/MocA family oxidoreductase [Candidatus Lokiarchaeia archaeon]